MFDKKPEVEIPETKDTQTLEVTTEFRDMLQEMTDRQRLAAVSALFWTAIWARISPFGEAPSMKQVLSSEVQAVAFSPDTFVFDNEAEDTLGDRPVDDDPNSPNKDSAGGMTSGIPRSPNAVAISGHAYRQVCQNSDQVIRALERLKVLKDNGFEPQLSIEDCYKQTLESYDKSKQRRQLEREAERSKTADKVLSQTKQSTPLADRL